MFGSREILGGEHIISRCPFHFLILFFGTCRQRHADPCYVAVKILSTHATEVQGRLANELDILQRINIHVKAYPVRKHIATLLDNFTITDRHGPRLCLVFKALGAFNGSVYHPGQNLPDLFVKDIARQLLVALDFLHRECQIVHTGKVVARTPTLDVPKDFKPTNILITLPNAEETLQRYIWIGGINMPESSPPVVLSRPITPLSLGAWWLTECKSHTIQL